MREPLTVGFDLDLTLIDSRPGIAACCRALTAATGVPIDADLVVSRLGPPLRSELAQWFPAEEVDSAVATFRELYPRHAVTPSTALPGARDAVDAVHRQGGRVAVITSKIAHLAQLHLDHLDLAVDVVVGDRFGPGKTAALAEHAVGVYVGDHVHDMRSARAGDSIAVGVPSGPCTVDDLLAAGAQYILPDLRAFPGWLGRAE